ncbi:hypothetical protein [Agromyces sp. NPDC049794]
MAESVLPIDQSFAMAFWLRLSMHVVVGELWLWRHPKDDGLPKRLAVTH